jgi:hypothetical protein
MKYILKLCASIMLLLFNFFILVAGSRSFAEDKEDDNFKYHTVTTKEGLNFRVPEDMPIETRNGLQVPMPFDEYMYGKFKQMDSRLKSIETKLTTIQNILTAGEDSKDKQSSTAKPERNDNLLISGGESKERDLNA